MLKDLDFDWRPMRVALDGQSAIDFPRLNLKTRQEAKQFLNAYGYDVDDAVLREEIWRIYFQSVAFLQQNLLDPGEKIPHEFLVRGNSTDVLRLLMEASKPTEAGRWSCAFLRIMHIISHLDNDLRVENFQYARDQIFDRFDRFVVPLEGRRRKVGTGPRAVEVIRYIRKHKKDRNSILIKLLSKPHAIAEDIYDRVGFRFVTETKFDAYRLVRALFGEGLISAANIQPGRSVNTLIPFEGLQQVVDSTLSELTRGEIPPKVARRRIEKLEEEGLVSVVNIRNPFSSSWYRAIQFTCRQLISAPSHTWKFWNEVKGEMEKTKAGAAALKKIPITLREKRNFWYPFEIQIMDKASYIESIGGRSRHREYKAKQRLMARNRVLRDLV